MAFSDDALIASQSAGGAKDQALIEANIPGIELFTMFYSYANAYFNRQLTLGRDGGKSLLGGPRSSSPSFRCCRRGSRTWS